MVTASVTFKSRSDWGRSLARRSLTPANSQARSTLIATITQKNPFDQDVDLGVAVDQSLRSQKGGKGNVGFRVRDPQHESGLQGRARSCTLWRHSDGGGGDPVGQIDEVTG